MNIENRKTITDNLRKYDSFADKDDYIQLTQWTNSEGIDIDINGKKSISLTYMELEAVWYLAKALEFENNET